MTNTYQIPVQRAINGHLQWMNANSYSKASIANRKTLYKLFSKWVEETHPSHTLNDFTLENIEQFLIHLRETPYQRGSKQHYRSPKTINNYHILLRGLWQWAGDHDYAPNILKDMTPKTPKHTPIEPLTSQQITDLIRACNVSQRKRQTAKAGLMMHRNKAIISLLFGCMMRVSEATALSIKDVTFDRGGGGRVHIYLGKGDQSRYVPFTPRITQYLQGWLMTRPDDYDKHSPFFTNLSRNAGQRMNRITVSKLVTTLGQYANIERPINAHLLRTTGACHAVQNGMTAWELKEIMGHSDIQTTMRYVKAAKINTEEAMRKHGPFEHIKL